MKAGTIEGSDRWPVVIVRPGDNPLERLTEKVVPRVRELRPDPALSEIGEQDDLLSRLRAGTDNAVSASTVTSASSSQMKPRTVGW